MRGRECENEKKRQGYSNTLNTIYFYYITNKNTSHSHFRISNPLLKCPVLALHYDDFSLIENENEAITIPIST
jgi:hypothetical protein